MTAPATAPGRPRIGLALGGGGARGLAHLGVVQGLRELRVPIDCVAGTSIGSIIGAVVASDRVLKAVNWTQDKALVRILRIGRLFAKLHVPWRSMLGSEKIEEFFRTMITAKTFDELVIPFAAVATDLYTGETVVMKRGCGDIDVHTAIRASMAIPGIFEPVVRDGRVLVDGSLSSPVPVDICRELGAEKVIAVDINPLARKTVSASSPRLNLVTIVDQTLTLACSRIATEMLPRLHPDILLRPAVEGVMMLDFIGAKRLVEVGRRCVLDHREEILRMVHDAAVA